MHAHAAAGAVPLSPSRDTAVLQVGQLAHAATGGDLDAFEELVRRMQPPVYGFAFHHLRSLRSGFPSQHLRDLSEAQDLTQEIFVKLYRNLARFDATRPFEPWFWKL